MKREAIRSICEMILSHDISVTEITKEVLSSRLTKIISTLDGDEQHAALDIMLSGTCLSEELKKGQVYWSDYGRLYVVVESAWGLRRAVLKQYRLEKDTVGPEGVIMSSKNRGDFFKAEGVNVVYYEGDDMWKAPCYNMVAEIEFLKEPSLEQLRELFKKVIPGVEC